MRKYFVSYYFTEKNGSGGYGCMELNVNGLVRDISVIADMAGVVKQHNKFKKVVITHWQRFEEPHALLSERSGS